MRAIVIVVDKPRDFMMPDGALAVAGAEALIALMADWLGRRTAADTAAVLFTFDTHLATAYAGSAEAGEFPPHCIAGTPGWTNMLDPVRVIAPAIPFYRLEKGVFAMWQEDGLLVEDMRDATVAGPRDAFFAGLRADGVTQAMVIGVAADYCVRFAIDGLVERGFTVSVPAGLTRGIVRQIGAVVAEDFAGAAVTVD